MKNKTHITPAHTRQVIRRFENAVESYVFRGTIPLNESAEAFAVYSAIECEYKSAKLSLLKMVDKLNRVRKPNHAPSN